MAPVNDFQRREDAVGIVIVVKCKTDLLEIVFTGSSPSRFASLLNGRKQKCYKDCDNRNHDQ